MKQYLCVFWEVDSQSYRRLELLSHAAAGSEALCASFHPHITLACYEEIDNRELLPYAREFAAQTAPFPVRFEEVGLLSTDIAACFPAFRGGLRDRYIAWHLRFSALADVWTSPSGGLYTPHVTLFTGEGSVSRPAQQRIAQAFEPFAGQVTALAVSWVKGENDYQVLARHSLSGGPVLKENADVL